MHLTTTAGTWGITGAQFLWGYGALCAAAAIAVAQAYRRALGPAAAGNDPLPELGVPALGLLSGGPDCAITAAAAQLYHDGLLRGTSGTLAATGDLGPLADPLEREMFETVSREPGLSVTEMRARVRDSAAMRAMTERMTSNGLLLAKPQATRIRLLWIVPALLTALGIARIIVGTDADRPVSWLWIMTAIAGGATWWLLSLRPVATSRGRRVVERLRAERASLLRHPIASQSALTAALFGGGALWLAEPAIASALGVPREQETAGGGGGLGNWGGWGGWGDWGDWGGSDGGGGGGGGGGCGGGGGGGG